MNDRRWNVTYCKKTSQFLTQCNSDISHGSKTAKIIVFDPVICKAPDAPLQDELLCWTCGVYCYFYFMQRLCHSDSLTPCMTLNCALGLHYSNYVKSTFKARQGEWSLLSGQRWYVANFELVFPSREVVRVDWFSVGLLMLVGQLFSLVISAYYKCSVQ